jgi:D-alanyl-D-alanine carboxypeptidase
MRQHNFGGSTPFLGTARSRWIAVALSLATLLGAGTPSLAAGRAALVIDANTGQDLHAKDADRPLYPASLTKMMTLYLTFERIEQKRISYTSRFQVSEACAGKPPSNLGLSGGESLTVREAVLALIVKSANDVACVVGENIAGSEDKFAALMTSRARQLGMRATTFRNASGLPDPGQVTTARDMATLALRLSHDFPEHYKLFSTREFTFNGHTHRSHNSLLHGFEGTDGIKTGYTRSSGFNLVSSVRRGQKHVIGVVFGGVTAAQRNSHMRAILTQGFGRAKAMASPLLVRRPALVAEPLRTPDRPPVPRRVAQAGTEATATDAPFTAPTIASAPAHVARASTPRQPLLVASATGPAPIAAVPPRSAPERMAATPAVIAPGLGRPPATLQDQASGRTPATIAAPVQIQPRAPVVAAAPITARPVGLGAPAAGGPFQVQIGAFSTQQEAQRQLSAVSGRAGAVLTGHAPLTVPFAKANLQFYRARFAGFDEGKAQAACQSLKQQKIECVVMRAE